MEGPTRCTVSATCLRTENKAGEERPRPLQGFPERNLGNKKGQVQEGTLMETRPGREQRQDHTWTHPCTWRNGSLRPLETNSCRKCLESSLSMQPNTDLDVPGDIYFWHHCRWLRQPSVLKWMPIRYKTYCLRFHTVYNCRRCLSRLAVSILAYCWQILCDSSGCETLE